MPDVTRVAYAVLGFGFIIFIHELGHFLAAKIFGVKVEAFSLGFPPTILHRKFGETDYRVGIIPMGGYVSMLGEDPREPQDDPRALCNARPWKRGVVFLAGVAMNVATAMVIYMTASIIGIQVTEPVVGGLNDGSPAQTAGIEVGDRIVGIDGKKVESFDELRAYIAVTGLDDIEHEFQIRYERDGMAPQTVLVKAQPGGDDIPLPSIGIEPPLLPRFDRVADDSPAAQMGLRAGDVVTAVDGNEVWCANQIPRLADDWPARPMTFTVKRGETTEQLTADPAKIKVPDYGLDPATRIKHVEEDSPAAQAGLKDGDEITRIGDIVLPTFLQIHRTVGKSKDTPLQIQVRREGTEEPITVTVVAKWNSRAGRPLIGVGFEPYPDGDPVIRRYSAPGPAAAIPDGSRVKSINGASVSKWTKLQERLNEAKGKDVAVVYVAPDSSQEKTVTLSPQMIDADSPYSGAITEKLIERSLPPVYNPLAAFNIGVKKIVGMVKMQYVTIKALANRTVSAKEISGPLRITVIFYESSKLGVSKFMTLLGLVSVAIALMNAMPIPPLDGGHVLFLVIEKIMRRPVPIKVRNVVTIIGTVLLLSVVAMAFINDGRYIWQNYL